MQLPRYNMPVLVLTFVVTLGILLGGRWVYREFGVTGPLQKKLADLPTVRQVEFAAKGNETLVRIELGKVESLQASFREIKALLPAQAGYAVEIADRRTPDLEQLWRDNRLVLEEAAVLGNLTEMEALLRRNLAHSQLDGWLLEADRENLYLQLHAGDHYLYEIVPRQLGWSKEGEVRSTLN